MKREDNRLLRTIFEPKTYFLNISKRELKNPKSFAKGNKSWKSYYLQDVWDLLLRKTNKSYFTSDTHITLIAFVTYF